MNDNEFFPSPNLKELKTLIQSLREDVAFLFLEVEDLRTNQCRQIQSEYQLKIGFLEEELFHENLELKRIRRKIAMIQACLNRHETVDLDVIEKTLEGGTSRGTMNWRDPRRTSMNSPTPKRQP
ncbi:MAG: hypothetical protein Q4D98_11810 [Planctomycetia bacterium]|nr:hypothetical protein [Planctomycetia bacterium]